MDEDEAVEGEKRQGRSAYVEGAADGFERGFIAGRALREDDEPESTYWVFLIALAFLFGSIFQRARREGANGAVS